MKANNTNTLTLNDLKYDIEEMTGNIEDLQDEVISILTTCRGIKKSHITLSQNINNQNIINLHIENIGIFYLTIETFNNEYEIVEVNQNEQTEDTNNITYTELLTKLSEHEDIDTTYTINNLTVDECFNSSDAHSKNWDDIADYESLQELSQYEQIE